MMQLLIVLMIIRNSHISRREKTDRDTVTFIVCHFDFFGSLNWDHSVPWVQAAKPTRQKTDVSKWSQVFITCILFLNSCINILAVERVVYSLTDSPGVVCVYFSSGGEFYFS